ncbi:MAG: hypothetical protein AAF346_10615 [Pseudomonadota bacterium]
MSSGSHDAVRPVGLVGLDWVNQAMASINNACRSVGQALQASREFQRLNDCSDAQLESLGLQREELPRHVFNKHVKKLS